jgi:hypothetical protein
MSHPLNDLVEEINRQIISRNYVNIFIDKETIDEMRRSMYKASIEAGGIDGRIKDFGSKTYTIREDANWIRQFVKRKVNHKLAYIIGGTEIRIMTDRD